jgi:hypothetical protein
MDYPEDYEAFDDDPITREEEGRPTIRIVIYHETGTYFAENEDIEYYHFDTHNVYKVDFEQFSDEFFRVVLCASLNWELEDTDLIQPALDELHQHYFIASSRVQETDLERELVWVYDCIKRAQINWRAPEVCASISRLSVPHDLCIEISSYLYGSSSTRLVP